MSKMLAIAIAIVVFLALAGWALLKFGWLVITKIGETGKHKVTWEGPKARVTKRETVVVEEATA